MIITLRAYQRAAAIGIVEKKDEPKQDNLF
jgi:hypothetical protein